MIQRRDDKRRRREENARRASQTIQRRTVWFMVFFGLVCTVTLFYQLFQLQINRHDELQARAADQQTLSTTITASRGTIYDRNGNALAVSASTETIFLSPLEIAERSEAIDGSSENSRLKNQYEEYVARGLARILDLEEDYLLQVMEKTYSQYEVIREKAEQDVADQVRRFINGEIDDQGNEVPEDDQKSLRLRGIYLSADSKRYYPYHTLASHVIGFINKENRGAYGTEAVYESVLQGVSGLTVSAKDANNQPMLYQYEQYFDAQDGNSVYLTIDTTIQSYLESGLEEAVLKYQVKNGGTAICLDVNTGAILGMASYPNYDLENYNAIYTQILQQELELASAEEYAATLEKLQYQQWRNKCINDTYEPGSTFKILTLSMALEEGAASTSSTYDCKGYLMVPGWSLPIHCDKRTGHGHQTLAEATANSCNPAFMTMAMELGTDTFYDYMEAFGLLDKTGVDLQGEQKGVAKDRDGFGIVDLATYSFGQNFTVTPLQLIAAQAACINGGYLYVPYVVEKIVDSSGNVVEQHDATPVRQVISEETSKTVCQILQYVVDEGTGRNGAVLGYKVGGKTGTAEKNGSDDVVVSFVCMAPADDPQVILLMTLDSPGRDTGTYVSGGQMVAPATSEILENILPYLGIDPEYTAEEVVGADATVPNVIGMTLEQAEQRLKDYGFAHYKTVGGGETVTDQTPLGGAIVPGNAEIILYLGEEKPDTLCTVPSVVGLSASEANKRLSEAGLIMKVTGNTNQSSKTVIAISQSQAQGTQLEAGSVVEVRFGDTSIQD